MNTRRQFTRLLALASLCAPMALMAQNFPSKPISLVVPVPPGGLVDTSARLIAEPLGRLIGQSVVIENKGGASGNLAYQQVARSAKDGHSLLVSYSGYHVANPILMNKLPWELKDFTPVGLITVATNVVAVHPSVPVNTMKEFIAYAKANPGKLNYGSSGPGSAPHLMTEQLNAMAGIQTTHIAYKGVAPLTTALIQGELQFALANIFTTLPHVKAGRMKLLATGGVKRSPIAPDVPTIAEAGLPGYDSVVWYGFFAPAKTPRPIVELLHKEIVAVLRKPDVAKIIIDGGNEPVGNTPAEFTALVRAEAKKWGALGRKLGVTLD